MQNFVGIAQQKLLDADNDLCAAISAGTLSAANIYGDILKSWSEIDALKGTVNSLKDKARLAKSTVAKEYLTITNKLPTSKIESIVAIKKYLDKVTAAIVDLSPSSLSSSGGHTDSYTKPDYPNEYIIDEIKLVIRNKKFQNRLLLKLPNVEECYEEYIVGISHERAWKRY